MSEYAECMRRAGVSRVRVCNVALSGCTPPCHEVTYVCEGMTNRLQLKLRTLVHCNGTATTLASPHTASGMPTTEVLFCLLSLPRNHRQDANMFSAAMDYSAKKSATVELEAPTGPLGLVLVNAEKTGALTFSELLPESPLHLKVGIGWQLLSIDGKATQKNGCTAAAERLVANCDKPRALQFLDPEELKDQLAGSRWRNQSGEVCVVAPAGRLGLALKTDPARGPVVDYLFRASPLVRQVAPDWRLLSVDGTDVTSKTHDEAVSVLAAASERARVLVFEAPPLASVVREQLVSLGSLVLRLAIPVAIAAAVYAIEPEIFAPFLKSLDKVRSKLDEMPSALPPLDPAASSQWNKVPEGL